MLCIVPGLSMSRLTKDRRETKRAMRATSLGDNSVLPLINIVFLLLIFFMIAGRITASDPVDMVPLRSISDSPADTGQFTLYVSSSRSIFANDLRIPLENLVNTLDNLAIAESSRVLVKADAAVDSIWMIEVLEQLHATGIDRIELITLTENGF